MLSLSLQIAETFVLQKDCILASLLGYANVCMLGTAFVSLKRFSIFLAARICAEYSFCCSSYKVMDSMYLNSVRCMLSGQQRIKYNNRKAE